MSLINDALKRARQAQQRPAAPPPALSLRPAEHAEPAASRPWVLPVVGLVLFAAVFALWRILASHPVAGDQEVAPGSGIIVEAKGLPPAEPPVSELAPAAVPAETDVAAVERAPEVLPDMTVDEPAAAIPAAAPAPPEPPPLRLQAIVFNPSRPSALISGKTVFIGERINGLRVTAITRETAVLVGGGQTNVLTLPE